jgi:hypothetical protein
LELVVVFRGAAKEAAAGPGDSSVMLPEKRRFLQPNEKSLIMD